MMLKVKHYRVYDFTRKILIKKDLCTRNDAEDFIKKYDAERREEWLMCKGNFTTFVQSKYLIIEMVGTVDSKLVKYWKEDIIEEFEPNLTTRSTLGRA